MASAILDKLKWLGHDGFLLETDLTIYIDPFQIGGGPKADLVLITHEHYDHCSLDDIAKIQKEDTIFITEQQSAEKIQGDVKVMKPGETLSLLGITIETVPSYNTNKKFHPKENGWLGFIIEINGERIYHTGDADFIPEMNDIQTDVALIPVSGTYVMTAQEAVNAALAIKPKIAIPMHYGAIVGSEQDALDFQKSLEGKIEVRVLTKE